MSIELLDRVAGFAPYTTECCSCDNTIYALEPCEVIKTRIRETEDGDSWQYIGIEFKCRFCIKNEEEGKA